mgnify:CR=1 FL=1
MGCPEYVQSDEIKELIQILLDEREDLFGDLKKFFWPDTMVACGLRVDKEPPKKQKWTLKIEGVKGSKTLLNGDVKYIIHGYKTMWDGCSSEKKIAHIANMMKRIEFPTPDELQNLAEKGEEYEMPRFSRWYRKRKDK